MTGQAVRVENRNAFIHMKGRQDNFAKSFWLPVERRRISGLALGG